MGGIRDHEQEIYDLLRDETDVKWGVNNVALRLRMQTNKVIDAYDNLRIRGLVVKIESDEEYLYPYYKPRPDLVENYLGFREESIKFYEKNLEKNLEKLKKKKIFVKIVRKKLKTGGQMLGGTRSKKAQEDYGSFKSNLSLLITVTSTLPFAQVLGIIPKRPRYDKMILQTQRKALSTAKKFIEQLYTDHKDHADIIQNDLKWSVPVLEELQRMPNIVR